jgi:hypothetical protein
MTAAPDTGEQERTEWGPAMAALPNDRQRAFVVALYGEEAPRKGDGLLIYAARAAGYGTPTSSTKSLGVIANRIVHDGRVQAAIVEHSRSVLRAVPPEAIRALKDLIRDPKARDHARAIAMVIDRTDPLQTLHTVRVEDTRPPSPEVTQKVLDRIEELMQRAGMIPLPPNVIDGEYSDVTEQALA